MLPISKYNKKPEDKSLMKRSQTKMEKEKNRSGGANRTFPALGAGGMVIRKIASCSLLVKYVSYMISG